MNPTRVLLVESGASIHRALGYLIDLLADCELVGVVATVEQALIAVARLRPDVLLMDAELPGALAAIPALRAAGQPPADTATHPLRIVLLSVYGRGERAARASGADAYLLKDCGPSALCAALRAEASPDIRHNSLAASSLPVAGSERRAPWD